MGLFRRKRKGGDGTDAEAKALPLVWCPTCPPRGKWVKAYRPNGPPIKHKPCMDDDDTVITRQLPRVDGED